MANMLSSKKRARQNEKRRVRNRAARSTMRTTIKAARSAVESKNVEALDTLVSAAQSKLGKAAKTNLIKKNAMARKQSRLMKAAAKAKAGA